MAVIVLVAKDFTSPLFLVRTCEVLCTCTTFSLVASLDPSELQHLSTFRIFCMFTWCFFFTLSLLIHTLSIIHFHNLIPVSWKNLTVTVAVSGSLMNLSASVLFPWIVMNHHQVLPRSVAATVGSCFTFMAYTSESYILCTQAQEQRGYMGSVPGLLKIVQLWGGCQMIPLLVPMIMHRWQTCVTSTAYGVCILTSLVTLVIILGDFAKRCLLPLDRLMAGFSLIGVLLYMVATVICFTEVLQLTEVGQSVSNKSKGLVIMETVVTTVTLLAYTVDLAFSIKLLCYRSHT
ncbi:myeloid-associated differentiation marker-like [Solea senegalensis]|uniref:Myeloid-associated differentiation marker-like n=1 Tax=Solea senegalensis TaxID=28829 RepID=A0AAV6QAW7_SOLSE|nr:myeloid-associated differentiation marker-like [Solea senegalensis]KAG7486808.1 myeloid-associated differentiation marker-like [Solea senegalensis]